MSPLLASPRLQLAIRLLVGAFFVYASLDKIASPAGFAKAIYQWQVGGPVASNLVAVTLPWVELLAGALLIVGAWRRESAAVIALLLVVFLAAAGSVLARGIDVENCGCVSLSETSAPSDWPPGWTKGVGWFLVTRNLVMLAAVMVIVRVPTSAAAPPAYDASGASGLPSGGRSTAAPPGPPGAAA